jgi:hypothetical protein
MSRSLKIFALICGTLVLVALIGGLLMSLWLRGEVDEMNNTPDFAEVQAIASKLTPEEKARYKACLESIRHKPVEMDAEDSVHDVLQNTVRKTVGACNDQFRK